MNKKLNRWFVMLACMVSTFNCPVLKVNASEIGQSINIAQKVGLDCPIDDIVWYTGEEGYKKINAYLRDKPNGEIKVKNAANRIHNWLKECHLPQETYALRGISYEGLYKLLIKNNVNIGNEQSFYNLLRDTANKDDKMNKIRNYFVGKEIVEKAFMSTSYIPEGFSGRIRSNILEGSNIILRICAPELSCACDISIVPGVRNGCEKELLFDCGTKFKIKGVELFNQAINEEIVNNVLKKLQDKFGMCDSCYVDGLGEVEKVVIDVEIIN